MDLEKYFDSLQERIANSAHVKTVFGEPVTAQGKTIIPVARIRYGFGGGMGRGPSRNENQLGEGGGGGGGVIAHPVGVVEITAEGTRFVPIHNRRPLRALLVLGLIAGYLLRRR